MANVATNVRIGNQQVPTAGTRVQMVDNPAIATVEAFSIIVQALSLNEGAIVVGDKTVVAAVGTHASPTVKGTRLTAGQSVSMDLQDITTLWLDTDKSGDGVCWTLLVA